MLLEPFASATRFWKAAAGLKNICENFDHGMDPKSTVVAMRYALNADVSLGVFFHGAEER